MGNTIHITNAKGINATVGIVVVKAKGPVVPGIVNGVLTFRKYFAATENCTDSELQKKFGEYYSSALIDGDPEIDIEVIGKTISDTQSIFLDSDKKLMFSEPHFIDIIYNPDGSEKERRVPVEVAANVNISLPIKWTGRKILISDLIRRFMFRRTVQLCHGDGLSFDFLFEIAKELEKDKSVVLLGTGDKGSAPLVFQANGKGYRGFLEGKTEGKRYQLLLHLSDMELKVPTSKSVEAVNG